MCVEIISILDNCSDGNDHYLFSNRQHLVSKIPWYFETLKNSKVEEKIENSRGWLHGGLRGKERKGARNCSVPGSYRHTKYSNHVCTRPGFAPTQWSIPRECCVAWRKKHGERVSVNSRNAEFPISFDSCLSESKRHFNPRDGDTPSRH